MESCRRSSATSWARPTRRAFSPRNGLHDRRLLERPRVACPAALSGCCDPSIARRRPSRSSPTTGLSADVGFPFVPGIRSRCSASHAARSWDDALVDDPRLRDALRSLRAEHRRVRRAATRYRWTVWSLRFPRPERRRRRVLRDRVCCGRRGRSRRPRQANPGARGTDHRARGRVLATVPQLS